MVDWSFLDLSFHIQVWDDDWRAKCKIASMLCVCFKAFEPLKLNEMVKTTEISIAGCWQRTRHVCMCIRS